MNCAGPGLFLTHIHMKSIGMYVLIGLVLAFVGVQTYTIMSSKGTPQQPYSVLKVIGNIEVRRYPEALTASVLKPGTTYKEVSNAGFRSLAGYIFGGNEGGRKIAMTAPVHMEIGADSSRMRFVMPYCYSFEGLSPPLISSGQHPWGSC